MSTPLRPVRRIVRQSRAALGLLRANVTRLETPLKLNLCVTYRCNYRCRTCNIWRRKPTGELTTDELLRLVARNRGPAWLDVTGGEIFLRPDIGDVLEAMVKGWKRLALLHYPTNGFLTDRIVAVSRRLVSQSTAQVIVTVSLDGDAELNDEIRGIAGGYRRQIETFNALRGVSGLRVVLGMTLSRRNLGHFERTFQACQRDCPGLRPEDFHLNVAQTSEHYYGNAGSTEAEMAPAATIDELHAYRRHRGAAWTPSAWVEHRYLDHLEKYVGSGVLPMRCHALRSSCFVDPWGTVYPCISYTRPLGSLRDTDMSLDPIWTRQATRDVQREIWAGECPQCWTPCEAYHSILGNVLRPHDHMPRKRLPLAVI
jgi:MoaA/NifB/PqqE/SkfB family radical SAM enzyme